MAPQMLNMGGPVTQARNFAVMTGVNAGVQAMMKRWRGGREDVQNQLVGESLLLLRGHGRGCGLGLEQRAVAAARQEAG